METEFENYITAYISKLVKKKQLDETVESKQQLIDFIMNYLTCELYPIALNYVNSLLE